MSQGSMPQFGFASTQNGIFDIYLFESMCYVTKARHASEDRPLVYQVSDIEECNSLLRQCEKLPGRKPPFEPPGPSLTILTFNRKSQALRSVWCLGVADAAETQAKVNSWIKRQVARKRAAKLEASALESLIPSNWYESAGR